MRGSQKVLLCLLLAGCAAPADAPTESVDWAPQIQATNDALLNRGELDRIPEFFAESYGHERIRNFISGLREAFPDLQVDVEVLVTEGDRVAWIRRHRGTHQAEYMGVPSTGNELTWEDIVVTRYDDGMIAQEWGVSGLSAVLLGQ